MVDRAGKEEPLQAPERADMHPRICQRAGRIVDAADQESDIWIWNLMVHVDPADFRPRVRSSRPCGGLMGGVSSLRRASLKAARSFGRPQMYRQHGAINRGWGWQGADVRRSRWHGDSLSRNRSRNRSGSRRLRVTDIAAQLEYTDIAGSNNVFGKERGSIIQRSVVGNESDESARLEIYVRPFADVNSGRWQVSTSGGRMPGSGRMMEKS